MKPLSFIPALVLVLLWGCGTPTPPALSDVQQSHPGKLKPHVFTLDAAAPKAVRTATLVLAFPVGCWLDAQGQPIRKGEVRIEVLEARSPADFVRAGLETRSGNKLLVSDGMFRLLAYRGQERLKLNPDVGVYVSVFSPKKDDAMQLFVGDSTQAQRLDWQLTAAKPATFDYTEKRCRDCEKLVTMVKKMKPKILKAQDEDPWRAMRYYWKNGTLMFFGSGVIDTVASVQQLKQCEAMLDQCGNSAALKKEIAKLQLEIAEQEKQDAARVRFLFYEYKLQQAGWHNLDKYTAPNEALVAVQGQLVDDEGAPITGPCKIHLVGVDMRIHQMHTSEDGRFEFQFLKNRAFKLLAFAGPNLATQVTIDDDSQLKLSAIAVSPATDEAMEKMIADM
jgi:hypothetical protein